MKTQRILSCALFALATLASHGATRSFTATSRYLNLPVSHSVDRGVMDLSVGDGVVRQFNIRLAADKPDYWVFADISAFRGKTVTLKWDGAGLDAIFQADTIVGQNALYAESNRPQVHFTARRGWINDPNGLIWYEGQYHLFYQHNPYERDWENMHWGHAVSDDLLHWRELPLALYPDANGTAFSGTAVIDYDNTSGFGTKGRPAMVAAYTGASSAKQVQCIAYSLDKGTTWNKYAGNPVVDSKAKWNSQDTRDPKVFWYAPKGHWVMVLNERDGHSIYTSADLKKWDYRSHTTGFWECPELFELPVDGDKGNTLWVMYGASGTYMLGDFDGVAFTPRYGKYVFQTGTAYAAQTFNNIPASDGRRIQMAWSRVNHKDMPFNGMMLLPTELTLRTTKDGVRLFSAPVKEVETLYSESFTGRQLTSEAATEMLARAASWDCVRIKARFRMWSANDRSAEVTLDGERVFKYNMNFTTVNDHFYSPRDMTSMEIEADIIADRTTVEVFVDGGAYSYSFQRRTPWVGANVFRFDGDNVKVLELEVHRLKSVWR